MEAADIVSLGDVEHVLLRHDMYIGSIAHSERNGLFLNPDTKTFEYRIVSVVDGLLKIINEILDNSVDEAVKTAFKFGTAISVTVTDDTITIEDNGRGIPTDKDKKTGMFKAELAFCAKQSGSNFDDKHGRTSIGMNGVGSFCTNAFSKYFFVDTCNTKARMTIECTDNMSTKKVNKKRKTAKTYTKVSFKPDLGRFGLSIIDDTHKLMIEQRLIHLAASYKQIKFKYNNRIVKVKDNKDYLNYYGSNYECIDAKDYVIGIYANTEDEFRSTSYVNGLDIRNAGTHVDYIMNDEIVSRIHEKLVKKHKSIKKADIKSKISIVTVFKNFTNPRFDGQTKEKLKNAKGEIKTYLGKINWEKLTKDILKNEDIITPIVEVFQLREEMKRQQELRELNKKNGKKKKVRCDKFYQATKKTDYFMICEGDSASGSLMSALGRERYGYFASKGVPINAYDVSIMKVVKNAEVDVVSNILGLQFNGANRTMSYKNVVIATDADSDGAHITGLWITLFHKYFKDVLDFGNLYKFCTPVVTLTTKGKVKHFFMDLNEYNAYIAENPKHKFTTNYYKGLGTWDNDELADLIKDNGMDMFLRRIVMDEGGPRLIDSWMGKKNSDVRKDFLKQNDFSIFSI